MLAMHRATDAGLFLSIRSSGIFVVAAIGLWVYARLFATSVSSPRNSTVTAVYTALASIAGGITTSLLAQMTVRWARASAIRTIAAALSSVDRLLVTVLRSSVALALVVEGIGFVCSGGIAALCWATKPQSISNVDSGASILLSTMQVLADFSIGAILVTLAIQSSGTTYRISTQIGSAVATNDANLGDHDPRNPSTIAGAAGTQLGQLVPNVLDAFCTALCANVLLMALLLNLRGEASSTLPAPYLLMPVVLRAFGVLASAFAAASARTMEALNPRSALLRSEIVFIVVVIGAICGSCTWLVPEQMARLSVCAMVGFLLPLGLSHLQDLVVSRTVQVSKSARSSAENPWGEGLFAGMLWLVAPMLILFVVMAAVLRIGVATGLGDGQWLAVTLCYLGMGISLPFCVTIESAHPLVSLARRTAHLIDSLRVDDGQRRLARLEETTRAAMFHAVSTQTQAAIGMPLLAALAIGMLAKGSGAKVAGTEVFSALYVCPIAFFVPLALILQSSLRASKAVANEVRRQLGGFAQDAGVFRVPAEFTPSYRNCVDIAARESTRKVALPSVAFVAIPLIYGVILCLLAKTPAQIGQALALFLSVVAIVTSVVGFVFEAANNFTNKVRGRSLRGANSQHSSTVGCTLHHLAGHATPAIRILAKATVIVALTFSPYVF